MCRLFSDGIPRVQRTAADQRARHSAHIRGLQVARQLCGAARAADVCAPRAHHVQCDGHARQATALAQSHARGQDIGLSDVSAGE